jgi:ribosome-associated translation inhibitor RaiA
MQIQINTDHNVEGREELVVQIQSMVAAALGRFEDEITRVEVHLSDQDGGKSGPNDKRCVMEARIGGRKPTAVTHDAATVDQAAEGAADKLHRSVERILGREHDHRR